MAGRFVFGVQEIATFRSGLAGRETRFVLALCWACATMPVLENGPFGVPFLDLADISMLSMKHLACGGL
jgi:hypothetical protein